MWNYKKTSTKNGHMGHDRVEPSRFRAHGVRQPAQRSQFYFKAYSLRRNFPLFRRSEVQRADAIAYFQLVFPRVWTWSNRPPIGKVSAHGEVRFCHCSQHSLFLFAVPPPSVSGPSSVICCECFVSPRESYGFASRCARTSTYLTIFAPILYMLKVLLLLASRTQ